MLTPPNSQSQPQLQSQTLTPKTQSSSQSFKQYPISPISPNSQTKLPIASQKLTSNNSIKSNQKPISNSNSNSTLNSNNLPKSNSTSSLNLSLKSNNNLNSSTNLYLNTKSNIDKTNNLQNASLNNNLDSKPLSQTPSPLFNSPIHRNPSSKSPLKIPSNNVSISNQTPHSITHSISHLPLNQSPKSKLDSQKQNGSSNLNLKSKIDQNQNQSHQNQNSSEQLKSNIENEPQKSQPQSQLPKQQIPPTTPLINQPLDQPNVQKINQLDSQRNRHRNFFPPTLKQSKSLPIAPPTSNGPTLFSVLYSRSLSENSQTPQSQEQKSNDSMSIRLSSKSNKAGLQNVDQEKVNKIILNATKVQKIFIILVLFFFSFFSKKIT